MNYYIDPKTDDLIIYDTAKDEIRVAKFIGEETIYEKDEEEEEIKEPKKSRKPRKPKEEKPEKERKKRVFKLTSETIGKIKEMRKKGASGAEIARQLDISAMTVYKYTKGIKTSFEEEEKIDEIDEGREIYRYSCLDCKAETRSKLPPNEAVCVKCGSSEVEQI